MTRLFRLILTSFLIACSALASAQQTKPFAPPDESRRTVYSGATLIDGTAAEPRGNMAVITRGEKIEAVLPVSELTPALLAGAERVDLRDKFLLPGLVDSHQHLATPADRGRAEALLKRQVYSGVTAVRIMADDLRSVAEIARASLVGEVPAPDLYFAAVVAGPSFFDDPRTKAISAGWNPGETPWAQAIDASTNIPLAIARARGTGATALKIYANLPPGLVRALTAEAKRQGMEVWAHGMVFPTPPADVIAAGPDVISHTCYLAYQVSDRRPQSYQERFAVAFAAFADGDHPVMTQMFREMRQRGIVLDPTMFVYRAAEQRSPESKQQPYCTLELAARLTDQARREGVLISAGTDGEMPLDFPLPAILDELELLVQHAGFSPLAAIRAATQVGALAAGQEEIMGTVEPGKLANLLAVSADPTADIRNIRQIEFTVKRGRRFDRADYEAADSKESKQK